MAVLLAPRMPARRRAAMLLCLLTLSAGLVSCSSHVAPTPVVVVATATSAEPQPRINGDLRDAAVALAEGSMKPGEGTIRLFISATGEGSSVDVTPMRPNGQVEKSAQERPDRVAEAPTKLDDLLANAEAPEDELDLLGVLDRAASAETEATIFVLSSGLQTVDPLDLNALGWGFDASVVATGMAAEDKLPDLSGSSLVFIGLGYPGGDQERPPISARHHLEDLWLAICNAAGAESCELGSSDLTYFPPMANNVVTPVDVPIDETPCSEPINLPGDVLFKAGTPDFTANPDAILGGVAEAILRCPTGVKVALTGHTARTNPVAGSQHDIDLSTQRANAVYMRLLALGVPATSFGAVTGVGDTQPIVDNWVNGQFVESLAAQNRRVVISYIPIA